MANIYPSQERYLDPYSTYFSDNVNKITRLITKKKDCIVSNNPVSVEIDPDYPTTKLIVRAGNFVKDDVIIEFLEDTSVDMESSDFYISGDPFNEPGTYYVVIDYTYQRTKPPVQASLVILKPSQYYWLDDRFLFLKAVIVIFNGSTFEISSISDYDPEPPYALLSNTTMYLPMIEGSGSTCFDSIGSFDGTIYGSNWVERDMYFKKVLRFDGTNSDYVQISDDIITLTNPFTVTAFFKFDSGDSSSRRRRIFSLLNGANSFEFGVHTSERRFVGILNGVSFSSESGILDPNTWYFVAVSVTSTSSINIYYSSSFSAILSATMGTSGITTNPTSSSVGGGLSTYHWLGSICEVRALNIAISTDQAMRLMKQPWLVDHAKANYTETYASLESKLPVFDSLVDIGKILYVHQPGVAYIGKEDGWTEFGVFDYTCDTSLCTLHQLAYIGAGNIAHPAIADSAQHFASCFVTKVDATEGRVRISGKITDGLVETGITITAGNPLFLSATEAGKVTNIDPHVNTQLIGICLVSSGSDYETVLSSLSGGSGVSVHNLLTGLEGGGGSHYYHLNLTDYTSLTSFGGNHNSIPYGLQGGTSTQRYHLTLAQYNAINSFGGNHNSIPYGLQGGSSTERYHLNSANYTALTAFGGNHNSCPTGLQGGSSTERYHLTASEASSVTAFGGNHNLIPSGLQGGNSTERYHLTADEYNSLISNLSIDANLNALKSYIVSLLNYNEDIYNIKDKDPYVTEQNIGKTPIGDVISGNKISTIATPYDTFGIFDSFIGSNWISVGNLSDAKYATGSFSLSNTYSVVAGGLNTTGIPLSTCESFENASMVWTSKTSFASSRGRNSVGSMTFTTSVGVISGGLNASYYVAQTDSYNLSSNTWATRTDANYAPAGPGSFSLTSDIGIMASGRNGVGTYVTNNSKYTLSSNSWSSLASVISYPRSYPASLTLNWDSGLVAGGGNASVHLTSCERLSLSTSSWTSRINLSSAVHRCTGLSYHSNFGLVSGGVNGGFFVDNNDRYNDVFNIFEGRDKVPVASQNSSGMSFSNTFGILAGGYNNVCLNSTFSFRDSSILTDISGGKFFMTDSSEMTPVHHKDTAVLNTIRLTNTTQDINKVIVSGLYKKQSTSFEISLAISLDDGSTWGTGYLDSSIDVSSLAHSGSNYYLRLNFYLYPNNYADTWTSRLAMISKSAFSAFGLTNYEGLTAGGLNSTGTASCQKYDDTANTWASRTAMLSSRYYTYGFQLRRRTGIVAGNAVPGSTADIYNDISNTWVAINSMNISRTDPGGFRLNDKTGVIAGGNNSTAFLVEAERFSSESYSWVMINSIPIGRDGGAGISLTTDSAMFAGGSNGTYPPPQGYSEKYFNSMNMWASRTQLTICADDLAEISLTPNYGLVSCGYNTSYINITQMYNDSGNIWTFRKNYPEAKAACGGISLTSELGLICGGEIASLTYTGSAARYNYGETSFIGFSVLPLS